MILSFSLMMMCKEGEGGKSSNAFVRIITGAPYPMMLLAFDWTLDDIVRFCTPVSQFSIMGIDPTFNLGTFDFTVTTYHHLLLTVQQNTIKHPVCIGPLFVHIKKDFSAYHFFASSLVGRRPAFTDLRCYGTDGEAALVNAFAAVFPRATNLRGFLHFRENIERKLQQLNISTSTIKEYRKDIFGNPSRFELGLVDAESESELDAMLNSLEEVWNDRDTHLQHTPPIIKSNNASTFLQLWLSEPGAVNALLPTMFSSSSNSINLNIFTFYQTQKCYPYSNTHTLCTARTMTFNFFSTLALFFRGNISRCNGCKGKIGRQGKKPLPPPDDVVLRHRETVVFQNPNTSIFQASHKPRNVYYHAWKTCVAAHFCHFNAAMHIRIEEVKESLTTVHIRHLAEKFNINID